VEAVPGHDSPWGVESRRVFRYPGEIPSLGDLWELVLAGRDAIGEFQYVNAAVLVRKVNRRSWV
jgi:hypothetical protein